MSTFLGDFNDDYSNKVTIAISLQSLSLIQTVSEPIHIRGSCLDQMYIEITKTAF